MRDVSVGINLGTHWITTVVVRQEKNGKHKLAALGRARSSGMRRGSVIDTDLFAPQLKKSLLEASKKAGFQIKSAAVSFSGVNISSSLSRGVIAISRPDGEITNEDVKRALTAAESLHPKNPNREVVHIIPKEFRVDGEAGITHPIGMVGMRLEAEALIIDAPKVGLQNITKAFDAVGVEIENWLFSPLAVSEAVLTPRQKESARQVWQTFKANPFDPRLRAHKIHRLSALSGRTIYAIEIEADLRVTFCVEGDTVVSLTIGTHDIYGQ